MQTARPTSQEEARCVGSRLLALFVAVAPTSGAALQSQCTRRLDAIQRFRGPLGRRLSGSGDANRDANPSGTERSTTNARPTRKAPNCLYFRPSRTSAGTGGRRRELPSNSVVLGTCSSVTDTGCRVGSSPDLLPGTEGPATSSSARS